MAAFHAAAPGSLRSEKAYTIKRRYAGGAEYRSLKRMVTRQAYASNQRFVETGQSATAASRRIWRSLLPVDNQKKAESRRAKVTAARCPPSCRSYGAWHESRSPAGVCSVCARKGAQRGACAGWCAVRCVQAARATCCGRLDIQMYNAEGCYTIKQVTALDPPHRPRDMLCALYRVCPRTGADKAASLALGGGGGGEGRGRGWGGVWWALAACPRGQAFFAVRNEPERGASIRDPVCRICVRVTPGGVGVSHRRDGTRSEP